VPSERKRLRRTRWDFDSLDAETERLNSFARQAFDPSLVSAAFPAPPANAHEAAPTPPIDRAHRVSPLALKTPARRPISLGDFDLPSDLFDIPLRRDRPEQRPRLRRRVNLSSSFNLDAELDRFVDEIEIMRHW
jgi:hypothetical protein